MFQSLFDPKLQLENDIELILRPKLLVEKRFVLDSKFEFDQMRNFEFKSFVCKEKFGNALNERSMYSKAEEPRHAKKQQDI